MASTDRDYDIASLRKQLDRDRKQGYRTAFSRGRSLEANVHGHQLHVVSHLNLRDDATGKFFFTVGYSRVGGTDIVRPT